MTEATMLLEAGELHKDDDARRPISPRRHRRRARFENWVKRVGVGVLGIWSVVAVTTYWFWSAETTTMGTTEHRRKTESRMRASVVDRTDAGPSVVFPKEAYFMVVGDYGSGTKNQVDVAAAMDKVARRMQPSPLFVISTGDQVYEHGITSADDPALTTMFEKIYTHERLQIPWYVTIGNHDCEGSIDAMLQYANRSNSMWYMPQRYYTVDHPVAPKTILRVVVLDACDLVCGQDPRNVRCTPPMNEQTSPSTRTAQYEWLEQVLGAGAPPGIERMWTIVTSHWSIYSYAGNANTPQLIHDLDPLLKKYKVHAYFSGHDHCLQHVRKHDDGREWNYFVSGAGGYTLHTLRPKAREDPALVHAAMTFGFISVHVTNYIFRVQMVDMNGDVLYTTDVPYEQR